MKTQSSQQTEDVLEGIMMPLDSMEEMVIVAAEVTEPMTGAVARTRMTS